MSEYERWEGRFGVPDYVFGKAPNYFLASCKALLPKSGKVLAVADGEGRNGVWLAEQGLDVLSIDFSPSAQHKAQALANERGVSLSFERTDVHSWHYPEAAFDVVVEIFTQFSSPAERAMKWAGMRKALKPGGLEQYYRDNVMGGPGSFVMVAEDFQSFGRAIVKKMIAEIASLRLAPHIIAR